MTRITQIAALSLILFLCLRGASGQEDDSESVMRSHYDAAYRLQSDGKFDQADREYTAFLVATLGRLANGFANTGNYAKAKLTYEEALRLEPRSAKIVRDFAAAALNAKDTDTTERLLSSALSSTDAMSPAQQAEVHVLRGKLQLATQGRQADLNEFRSAVELDASCENIYELATAELAVGGPAAAERDSTRYRARCGDTPATRIKIGRAYAINGAPDRAVVEFRAAEVMDPHYPDVHYCIGAALLQSSKSNFDAAEAELRKELLLHPNDRFSHAQLGHIAILRHNDAEAERDYRRAVALNPREASNFIELGQLLATSNRGPEAEPLLRKAIELTPDPSRNNYDIERAHFQLGRVLMKAGHQEEAQRELAIAADLLNRSRHQAEADLNGESSSSANPLAITRVPTEQEKSQVEAYVRGIAPLLASAYNNLGVHMANTGSLSLAASDFAAAARWNPRLSGVDANWGKAAYLAGEYADAVAPLERAVRAHPEDSELNGILESSRQHAPTTNRP